jgi:hypothetical protein
MDRRMNVKNRRLLFIIIVIVLVCESIAIVLILSGNLFKSKPGIPVAKNISERQPEPTDGLSSYFPSIYAAKNKTDKNAASDDTVIPCFKEYDLLIETWGCFGLGSDADWDYLHSSQFDLFERMVKMYPEPLVRETDDNYYLVYQTDQDTRLFLFYSKESLMFLTGYPIIMKETHSYKDFSGINVGDSIIKVSDIDSIMPLYYEHFELRQEASYEYRKKQGIYFTSMHLLSDGILRIDYDRVDGDYVIIGIAYNKDFVLEGKYRDTCYKIFEMDYLS